MKKGAAIVTDPHERRVRALMMLEYKLKNGATIPDIAEEFGVSDNTVKRELSFARKAKLIVGAEDKILNELMPAAHEALKLALGDTEHPHESAKIALEIFKGILPGFSKKQGPAAGGGDDELQRYIASLRSELVGAPEDEVVDALPSAAQADAASRLLEADRVESAGADNAASSAQRLGEEVV